MPWGPKHLISGEKEYNNRVESQLLERLIKRIDEELLEHRVSSGYELMEESPIEIIIEDSPKASVRRKIVETYRKAGWKKVEFYEKERLVTNEENSHKETIMAFYYNK